MDWRRHAGTAWALTVGAGVISFFLIDRPLAFFAHDHLRLTPIFAQMQKLPEPLQHTAVAVAIVAGILVLSGRTLSRWQKIALVWAAVILVTTVLTDELKVAFGRTWPETWTANNPSLIRDGVFGFNPFHGGRGYTSFPSGHTADIVAAMTVPWVLWPRWRPLAGLAVAVVVTGLIGANYHFLSDIIAGGTLGAGVALATLRLTGLGPAPTPATSSNSDA